MPFVQVTQLPSIPFRQRTRLGRRAAVVTLLVVAAAFPAKLLASEYFVDAVNGNDIANGLSPATAWRTIAKVNSKTFQPGDIVRLRRGQIWAEGLEVYSTGTTSSPIVFTGYGAGNRPVLTGAKSVTGWQQVQGTVYRATLATEPYQVFHSERRLVRNWGSPQGIQIGEWAWALQRLYINIGFGPSGAVIEVTPGGVASNYGIEIVDASHVVIDGLRVRRFRTNVFVTGNNRGSDWVTVRNCRVSDAFLHGIHGWDDSYANDHVTIHGNLVENSGSVGINWTKYGDGGTICHNTVTHSGRIADEESGLYDHVYPSGIKLWGMIDGISDIVVEYNIVEFTGIDRVPLDGEGNGIWVDRARGGNIIRYNIVQKNAKCGVIIEDVHLGGEVYYNVVTFNGGVPDPTRGFGVLLMRGTEYWKVHNNTIYGNAVGIGMGNWSGDGIPNHNQFANNLIYRNASRQIHVVHGAETLSNTFRSTFVDVHPGFVRWGTSYYGTINAWESAAGWRVDDTTGGSPWFVNPAGGDFRLYPGSPCLQAGVDVGLTEDIEGSAVSDPPTLGAYEEPYSAGAVQ